MDVIANRAPESPASMDRIEPGSRGFDPDKVQAVGTPGAAAPTGALPAAPGTLPRSLLIEWLMHDIPFLAMFLLALIGVVFRLPLTYWVILTPVFAVISIAGGWGHFGDRTARLALIYRVALDWGALLLAIYLLYNTGVQGVMNQNATSLAMVTLLALGTFVAGVQARVWQICVVGVVLFIAVPGLGWLDQYPLLLVAAACVIVALSGLAWWITQRRRTPVASGTPVR